MIPVHIWANSKTVNMRLFPDYFYEIREQRFAIYNRPIIHQRCGGLAYRDISHFSNEIFGNFGKPSIHVFVLSHHDILEGPRNKVLGNTCCTILNVSRLSPQTVVLFVNLPIPAKCGQTEVVTSYMCSRMIKAHCRTHPKLSAFIDSHHESLDSSPRFNPYTKADNLSFFRSLYKLISQVTFEKKKIAFDPRD